MSVQARTAASVPEECRRARLVRADIQGAGEMGGADVAGWFGAVWSVWRGGLAVGSLAGGVWTVLQGGKMHILGLAYHLHKNILIACDLARNQQLILGSVFYVTLYLSFNRG